MPETVLIADDHPIFRRGLRDVIEDSSRFRLVAEAENGVQALQGIREHRPAIALLDIDMPEADGLDVIGQAARWPDAPAFVILTLYDDEAYFRRAMELGALGYLLKDNAEDELIACLTAVLRGKRYLSPALSWKLEEDDESTRITGPLSSLTATERRILKLVSEYKSSREIAELLCISHRTVQNHRANIAQKLELRGANALLQFALQHGKAL